MEKMERVMINGNVEEESDKFDLEKFENMKFECRIRWPSLIVQMLLHSVTFYASLLILIGYVKSLTVLFAIGTFAISAIGITAGAHRLWSHNAYKATTSFKILLAILFTITGQRDIYTWALDHRVHHKYTDTAADPHNSNRGFLFSHVGWLVLTPHPAVEDRRKALRITSVDLLRDPVVRWQKRLFVPLFFILNIVIPVLIPCKCWNESLWNSFLVSFVWRFTLTLNVAFCVNSVAHLWGNKPYDKEITSSENFSVALASLGEGYHNYHHTFPFDYRTSELGNFNLSTKFIDLAAKYGFVYDRKTATPEMIKRRIERTGDGSRPPLKT